MAGTAGRHSQVKVLGASTAFTDEACTSAGDDLNYQITSTTKRAWSPTAAIVVKVGGSTVAASTYTLNRLNGTVTFHATATRVVTVSGTYHPTVTAARTDKYSFELNANTVDDTDFDTANADNGFMRKQRSELSISGNVGGKWDITGVFKDNLMNSDIVMLEFFPDRAHARTLACWAYLTKFQLQSAMDGIIGQDVSFEGALDIDGRVVSL